MIVLSLHQILLWRRQGKNNSEKLVSLSSFLRYKRCFTDEMSEWTQKKGTRGGEGGTRIEGGRVREVEEGGKKEGRKESLKGEWGSKKDYFPD